jgi:hypothetical protein
LCEDFYLDFAGSASGRIARAVLHHAHLSDELPRTDCAEKDGVAIEVSEDVDGTAKEAKNRVRRSVRLHCGLRSNDNRPCCQWHRAILTVGDRRSGQQCCEPGRGGRQLQINTKSTGAAEPSGGNLTIAGSSDLQVFGSSTANVTLEAGSTLTLDASTEFAGTVAGLAPGNFLDLPDIGFGAGPTLGYAPNSGNTGGVLTVSDGVHTANIALLGQYAASSFVTAGAGHGGTLITDPPASVAQIQMTLPHA